MSIIRVGIIIIYYTVLRFNHYLRYIMPTRALTKSTEFTIIHIKTTRVNIPKIVYPILFIKRVIGSQYITHTFPFLHILYKEYTNNNDYNVKTYIQRR